ncbi:MAG: ASKHA domain-containing protein [Clostridiales bacterium]
MEFTVNFKSHGKTAKVEQGKTILDAAANVGIAVEGNCGSGGKCGKCKVHVIEGFNPEADRVGKKFFTEEEMDDGWVLACRYEVDRDITVDVPIQKDAFSRKTKLNSLLDNIKIDSPVKKVYLELEKPSITDQCPDFERIIRGAGLDIAKQNPSAKLLAVIPKVMRDSKFAVTAVLHGENLMWVEQGDTTGKRYGIVFDIGTTTVVALLVNLEDGNILGAAAQTNPQNVFGADVISRINYVITEGDKGLGQLHDKVVECLGDLALQAIAEANVDKTMVYECSVVGNTTMSQLFSGVDPRYLAPAPFIPGYVHSVEMSAQELNFDINPEARIHLLPNIAGYVGSDTVGVILGTHIHEKPGYTVAIDVGTNGEIVVAGNNRILACSTAAGPAFEGAQIKHGTRAAEGAIEAVYIDNEEGTCNIDVIGDTKPKGICGSGILDAVAQLYLSGILNYKGAFNVGEGKEEEEAKIHPELRKRILQQEDGYEFILSTKEESAKGREVTICQKDIRELQLGKGAIYAGIKVLLSEMGVTLDDVKEVLIAGAFGSYIRETSGLTIGLFPELPNGKIKFIGNAASEGARLALVSQEERKLCEELARKSEYIELSSRMDFQDEYVMALYFPNDIFSL